MHIWQLYDAGEPRLAVQSQSIPGVQCRAHREASCAQTRTKAAKECIRRTYARIHPRRLRVVASAGGGTGWLMEDEAVRGLKVRHWATNKAFYVCSMRMG